MTELESPGAKWDEWVRAGLLTQDQVRAIGDYERARAQPEPSPLDAAPADAAPMGRARQMSAAVPEALGYLGGLLVLGGALALLGRVWDEIALAGRVGIAAAAAVILAVGGWFVDERANAARARLRAVLWVGSTAATATAVGLLSAQGLTDPPARTVVLLVAVAAGVQAGIMWAGRSRPLQLAVHLAAWPVAAGAAAAHLIESAGQGLVIWAVGAVMAWLGLYRVVAWSLLWVLVGALSALVGAAFVATGREGLGLGFALVSALGLLTLGMWRAAVPRPGARVMLTIVGGVATLQLGPTSIGYFSGEAGVLTGVATWVLGAVVVVAVLADRLRAPRVCEPVGAAVMVGGAAAIATQVTWVALVVGVVTSVGLLVLGTRPQRVGASLVGSGGLLIFVPWSISHFFPGEGRVPVLVTVTGVLILGVAVFLLRRRA